MKPAVAISLTSVLLGLLALSSVILAVFAGFGVLIDLEGGVNFGPNPVGWLNKTFLVGGISLLLLAIWQVVTIEGLLNLRHRARISIVLLGSLYGLFGIAVTLTGLVEEMRTPVGRSTQHSLFYALWITPRLPMTWFYLALAALGIWWSVYFRGAAAKAAFSPIAEG